LRVSRQSCVSRRLTGDEARASRSREGYRRLENVARAVGDPKRVMACTDCGFDTSAGMGRVTEDVVWAKLAAMAEGARIATQRPF
jgi:methionine synthase II (cobalamin-independent)